MQRQRTGVDKAWAVSRTCLGVLGVCGLLYVTTGLGAKALGYVAARGAERQLRAAAEATALAAHVGVVSLAPPQCLFYDPGWSAALVWRCRLALPGGGTFTVDVPL